MAGDNDDDKSNPLSFLGVPSDIGKAITTNFPALSGIGDFFSSITSAFSGAIFGIFSSPEQKLAKQDALDKVKNAEPEITKVIKGLQLDPTLADSIEKECTQMVNDSFGFAGMTDGKDLAKQLFNKQTKIAGLIQQGLADKFGTKYDIDKRQQIAAEAAASITGVDASLLNDPDALTVMAGANQPTKALGGLMFAELSQVKHDPHATSVESPKYTLYAASFDQAKHDLA